jgi:hydroxyethylthiazole kinase
VKVTVVRANASEILALGDADSNTKGVDTIHSVDDAAKAAQALANQLGGNPGHDRGG